MIPKPKTKQIYGKDVDNVIKQGKKFGQAMDVNNAMSIADMEYKEKQKENMGGNNNEVYKNEVMQNFLDQIENEYTIKELRKMYNFADADNEDDFHLGDSIYGDIRDALEKYNITSDEDVEQVWQNIFKALGIAK